MLGNGVDDEQQEARAVREAALKDPGKCAEAAQIFRQRRRRRNSALRKKKKFTLLDLCLNGQGHVGGRRLIVRPEHADSLA
jgi:hypothetical protein